jgi:hypothetical protein
VRTQGLAGSLPKERTKGLAALANLTKLNYFRREQKILTGKESGHTNEQITRYQYYILHIDIHIKGVGGEF